MSESSNVKTLKKGQSTDISIWWIIIALVITSLVFSIGAVIIAFYFTNVQLKDYATKNDLDSYVKGADFYHQSDAWANESDIVVKYGDSVQFQSTGTAQTGFLTNQQSGNAQFMDCNTLPAEEDGDTMNFLVYKKESGCSSTNV